VNQARAAHNAVVGDVDSRFAAAEGLVAARRYAEALHAYTALATDRVRQRAQDGSDPDSGDLQIIERAADLARLFGELETADTLFAAYEGFARAAGNRYVAGYASAKRVELAVARGDFHEAYRVLADFDPPLGRLDEIEFSPPGLKAWESGHAWPDVRGTARAVLYARLYLAMGGWLASNGYYANAIAAFRRGLDHAGGRAPDLARAVAPSLRLGMARALLEAGELDAARAQLDAGSEPDDEARDPGPAVERRELEAKLAMLRGEFGLALERFELVVAICRRGGLDRALDRALLNFAHLLILLNRVADAVAHLTNVRERAQRSSDETVRARADVLLSVAAARMHSLGETVPIAPSVSEMWGEIPDLALRPPASAGTPGGLELPQVAGYLAFFEDRELEVRWLLGQQNVGAAEARARELRQVFGGTDSRLIQLRLRVVDALVAYYRGQYGDAAAALEPLVDDYARSGLKPELWQLQRVLAWCWERLGRPPEQRQALQGRNAALLSELEDSLTGADRGIFRLNKWTAEEESLAAEIDRLCELRAASLKGSWLGRIRARSSLMLRLDALLRWIDRQRAARFNGGLDPGAERSTRRFPRLALLGSLLSYPRRRVTVSFLVLPDRVLLARRSWGRLDFDLSPVTRVQLRSMVALWHQAVSNAGPGDAAATPPKGTAPDRHGVQATLVDDLARALQIDRLIRTIPAGVRSISFVADDALHGFPFAAIVHDGKYLLERYAVSVAVENLPTTAPEKAAERDALIVGVAEAVGSAYPPLPGVSLEVDAIGKLLRQRDIDVVALMNASADPKRVRSELERFRLAHVACHGNFRPDRPDESGVVLPSSSGGDDLLPVRDLATLDLRQLEHVTLSACWGADNFILPGRQIISLPETLCRSGAGSVLACQWPVDDRAAIAFMTRFYAHLDESPRDEALRRVQADFLHGRLGADDGDYRSPLFWAGFVMTARADRLDRRLWRAPGSRARRGAGHRHNPQRS